MNTTDRGRKAESQVSDYLIKHRYSIIDNNWRHRLAEIDIVACKDKIIYFIEVKFRSSSSQGTGLEYITPKKLKQMNFAAELWVNQNKWSGDYQLLAAEVSGDGSIDIVNC